MLLVPAEGLEVAAPPQLLAAAAAKVVAAAEDKATPVDGQARPATLQAEAGRTQRHPSELDSGAMPMVTRSAKNRKVKRRPAEKRSTASPEEKRTGQTAGIQKGGEKRREIRVRGT